jgi:C1A family cysteine protease
MLPAVFHVPAHLLDYVTYFADDFTVQFNASVRYKRGLNLPAYRFNASAKPSLGHAALIVGWDNDDFSWSEYSSHA